MGNVGNVRKASPANSLKERLCHFANWKHCTWHPKFTVQMDGNVGIGTTNLQGILDVSSTTAGLEVYDTTANIKMIYNGTRWLEIGAVPIGTIQAWHGSLTGVPSLPWGWVQCSGQTLNDSASPLNGQVIPNLNSSMQNGTTNSGMFLRGAPTSGTMQANATVVNRLSGSIVPNIQYGGGLDWIGSGPRLLGWASTTVTLSSTDAETRPANMTVI